MRWLQLRIMRTRQLRLEPLVRMPLLDVHIHVRTGATLLGTVRTIVELQSRVYGHVLLQIALLLKTLLAVCALQIRGQLVGIFDVRPQCCARAACLGAVRADGVGAVVGESMQPQTVLILQPDHAYRTLHRWRHNALMLQQMTLEGRFELEFLATYIADMRMQILVYGLYVPSQSMHIGKAARERQRKRERASEYTFQSELASSRLPI